MVGVTSLALRLERERADMARQSALEENARLSLWRMDSYLSALLSTENLRPASFYSSPAGTPNPPPHIRLFFEARPDEIVPVPSWDGAGLDYHEINRSLEMSVTWNGAAARRPPPPEEYRGKRDFTVSQVLRNDQEWAQRADQSANFNSQLFTNVRAVQEEHPYLSPPLPPPSEIMRGVWVKGELLFVRQVKTDHGPCLQGAALNWPYLRDRLLEQIKDLLPEARLSSREPDAALNPGRSLSTLPLMLDPGPPPPAFSSRSPIAPLLAAGWIAAILAALAAAGLVMGSLRLGERRAAFVSAVTHELRTPLTSISLYAEMLNKGMVAGERQKEYLGTLQREAERLSRLIANVLAYSRLERSREKAALEKVSGGEIIGRLEPGLERIADAAGMKLEVEVSEPAMDAVIHADLSALDRILGNLVDNAAKYAAAAKDKTISLKISVEHGGLVFRVRDFGPGISRASARRLFRPFSKSIPEHVSAPGVGLGLSLSRDLARAQGGTLTLVPSDGPGALFILNIPLATPKFP